MGEILAGAAISLVGSLTIAGWFFRKTRARLLEIEVRTVAARDELESSVERSEGQLRSTMEGVAQRLDEVMEQHFTLVERFLESFAAQALKGRDTEVTWSHDEETGRITSTNVSIRPGSAEERTGGSREGLDTSELEEAPLANAPFEEAPPGPQASAEG